MYRTSHGAVATQRWTGVLLRTSAVMIFALLVVKSLPGGLDSSGLMFVVVFIGLMWLLFVEPTVFYRIRRRTRSAGGRYAGHAGDRS